MSANLFSSDWYRISTLKPNVRDHITVHAHRYRGRRWYMLEDHITGQVRRLTPQSYLIFGLMNGNRTVDDLWVLSWQRREKKEVAGKTEIAAIHSNTDNRPKPFSHPNAQICAACIQ